MKMSSFVISGIAATGMLTMAFAATADSTINHSVAADPVLVKKICKNEEAKSIVFGGFDKSDKPQFISCPSGEKAILPIEIACVSISLLIQHNEKIVQGEIIADPPHNANSASVFLNELYKAQPLLCPSV